MPLEIGTLLNNRYRLERVLGQGGFGAVYLATDQDLGLPCAVKENLNTSAQAERQFRREATLLASLRHPNLPRVTDHFVLAGQQYLVMDFIEGDDLKQRLDQTGPLPETDALRWVLQLCDALMYLHSLTPPVIHRDIKPANIKITPDGSAVLVDFGIAKASETGQKTTTGAAALTSGYAPPEQYQMGSTDGRTDEYALAATLYHLLTGRIPPDSVERLIGQARLDYPEDLRPDISPNVGAAIRRALEIRPDNRFPGVAALRDALLDPAFRYLGAPERVTEQVAAPPAAEATQAAATQAADAEVTAPRPRGWRHRLAAGALALFCLGVVVVLAAGLTWVFVGPWELNNRVLGLLGTPTNAPLRLAQVPLATMLGPTRTAAPTSTPLRSPTPVPPTATPPPPTRQPTETPPFTPTATPPPQILALDTVSGKGWRLFAAWSQAGVDLNVPAALGPDGATVALYNPQIQGVELYDTATGESAARLLNFIVGPGLSQPLGLAILPDSVLVLFSNKILRQASANNAPLPALDFFKPPARELRLSPDQQWLAVRGEYISVYNLQSKRLYNLGDQNSRQAFAFSPDGRYLALAVGTNVDLYLLSTGRVERRLLGRNKPVSGVAFTPDSARVVATSGDVWDTTTGERVAAFDSAADLQQVAISPDGRVAVGSDGDIWSLPDGALVGRLNGLDPLAGQGLLTFVLGGQFLFSQPPGQPLQLWTVDPNVSLDLAAGGTTDAVPTPDRDPITLLNLARLSALEEVAPGTAGVALSPSGVRAVGWNRRTLVVYDLLTRSPLATLECQSDITDAAFLGEDYVLAVTARGVERWDVRDAKRKQTYPEYTGQRLAASADANLFAVQAKYIQIVDVASGQLKFNLGSADSGQPFAFTPDGAFLAIAARSAVSLWDMTTGRQAASQFGGHGPEITGLAFTPDGTRLAAASGDVWDVATRRRLSAFDTGAASVTVSPDGQLVVGADGTLWAAETGQYLGQLAARARALAFTADGRTLLWQATDGTVSVYGIRPLTAHTPPTDTGAAAPDFLPLSPANVISATVVGWWGQDPLLALRLVADPAEPLAAEFGNVTFQALTHSPDGRTVTGLFQNGIELVDPASGAVVDVYQIFLNPETIVEAAYLGQDLLVLKERAGVERWDLAAQTMTQRYNVQGRDLVVSADGRWFALRQDATVLVVDAATGEVKHQLRGQAGPQAVQFAPDSTALVVANGLFADVVNLETGRTTTRLRGRGARVYGLAFASDKLLLAASGDAWTWPDGANAYAQKLDTAAVRLAVGANGALAFGDDGAVFDTATGGRVATLPEVRAPAEQLLSTADGRQLLWRTAAGQVYAWGVRPASPAVPPGFGASAVTVPNAALLKIQSHLGRGRLLNALWSPRDQYLAVNTTENVVVYDGATLRRLSAYLDATALTFDAQGQLLLGGEGQPLRLVNPATGQLVRAYERSGIIAAAFSPDGQRLALGGRVTPNGRLDGLAVIDPDGLERQLTAGSGSYTAFTRLEFTADGRFLVASFPGVNTQGSIWIWDVANGSRVRQPIEGNTLPAALSPDGRFLTYLSGTRFIVESLERGGRLFTINADGTPFLPQSIDIPDKFPISYSYTQSGQLLVFYRETSRRNGGVGASAYLWTIGATSVEGTQSKFVRRIIQLSGLSGRYLDEYTRDRDQHTPAFAVGPSETRFYALTGDGVVRVYDYANGNELAASETDLLPLMALSPDGATVAVADALGWLEIRRVADGEVERVIPGPWSPAALAYASDSVLLVLQADRVAVVNVATGGTVESYPLAESLFITPQYFSASPDGRWFALWGRPGGRSVLNVYGLNTRGPLFSLSGFPRPDQVRFSPDGRRLAVVKNRTVEVWSLDTRQVVHTLTGQGRAIGALAFSPDGTRLAAASGEIWNLADGTLATTFDSQAALVRVSPTGEVLIGDDGTVWNALDGLLTGALSGWRGRAVDLAFTPDGTRLLWQDESGLIEVWALGP